MDEKIGALDTLVQEKIEADAEFQTSIAELPEEEKETLIQSKRAEILADEFASLREKADKATKAEELANNYKARAEKAEKLGKKGETEPNEDSLSTKDLYALMTAQVPQDDVDEVVKASKILNVSIQEALKDPTVQTILEKRAEYRKTAQATNTGIARPSTKKVTDEEILSKASKGELPEKGSDEAERLFWARRGGKR